MNLPSRLRITLAAHFAALLIACGYDVHVNAPSQTASDSSRADSTHAGSDSTNTGTFQRADLTVVAVMSGLDSAVAAQAGLTSGRLRGASVSIQRTGSAGATGTADSAGRVTFRQLLPGYYTVSVSRLVTAVEAAGLDSTDSDVNAFAGGTSVNLTGRVDTVRVPAVAGRRGSLVISEIFTAAPVDQTAKQTYLWSTYIELYNNADTTIYLDGKVIGTVGVVFRDHQQNTTCDAMAPWRDDPDGIWSIFLDAFPGSGRDYPLAPGHTAVVATDAIDHSVAWPGLLDLSHADFEFHGSNDVDNPLVPNMLDVGLREHTIAGTAHGLLFVLNEAVFVADSLTVSALPHYTPPYGIAVVRIPASKILDVFTTSYTPAGEAASNASGFTLCAQIVNQKFDRQYASILDPTTQLVQSMVRQVFATLPNGRVILLRTKSSANDFGIATPTPGTVGH